MSRILALSTLAVLAVGSLSLSTSAVAADAVIEEDPAPPEPAVELSPENRWYVGARIGAAFADDTSFNTLGTVVTNSYDTGYVFSGAIGYEFGTGSPISARLEGELGYTAFDIIIFGNSAFYTLLYPSLFYRFRIFIRLSLRNFSLVSILFIRDFRLFWTYKFVSQQV